MLAQIFALTDWREGFHLFGGSDKQPWSADGSLLLGMRTDITPRDLKPTDAIQLGVIPFAKGGNSSRPNTLHHRADAARALCDHRTNASCVLTPSAHEALLRFAHTCALRAH